MLGSDFPPLPTSASGSRFAAPRQVPYQWRDLISSQPRGNSFSLSFIPNGFEKVRFSTNDIAIEQKDWELALVGHAIGKRPYYGALLTAFKNRWHLKGSFELLTMEGDFFLFKFSCREDFDNVWDNGPCFLNGRLFIFKKWSRDFQPVKEEIEEIPLWVKFPNFPLYFWNELGISKVASCIGVPIAVDNLTVSKSRITFARICVQVSPSSNFLTSIPLDLDGFLVDQKVVYDWKPAPCTACKSFSHTPSCPHNPTPTPVARGRSKSRARIPRPAPIPPNAPPPPPTPHPPPLVPPPLTFIWTATLP